MIDIDIVLPVLQGVITAILAVLGIYVTLHPVDATDEVGKRKYKLRFVVCIVLGLGLSVWQAFRNVESQRQLTTTLGDLGAAVERYNERPLKPPDVHVYPAKAPTIPFTNKSTVRFVHGLNTKSPQVTCYVKGEAFEPLTTTPVDDNTVVITFNSPVSGNCSAR